MAKLWCGVRVLIQNKLKRDNFTVQLLVNLELLPNITKQKNTGQDFPQPVFFLW